MLRLETRAREITVMASLTLKREGEGKPNSRNFALAREQGEARDLKGSYSHGNKARNQTIYSWIRRRWAKACWRSAGVLTCKSVL